MRLKVYPRAGVPRQPSAAIEACRGAGATNVESTYEPGYPLYVECPLESYQAIEADPAVERVEILPD